MTARHQILRRGRPYGPPLFDFERLTDRVNGPGGLFENLEPDQEKRGLHFICLNASLKSQFEFIQQAWINNARAPGNVANPDPMSSCPAAPDAPGSMMVPGEELDLRTSRLPNFVKARAGAYFFLPGLRTLRYLAQDLRRA
jgi:deferrochelatase/peroxidase EfeB